MWCPAPHRCRQANLFRPKLSATSTFHIGAPARRLAADNCLGDWRGSPSFNEVRSILGFYPPTEERSRADFAVWRAANGR